MKNKIIKVLFAFVSVVAVLCCFAMATGTMTNKKIDVIYNNIKLIVDGREVVPKDSSGNLVEPFIYDGTTYLPVRAVGEALGKEVKWDGKSKTVYLGEEISTDDWLSQCLPYSFSDRTGKVDCVTDVNRQYYMAGEAYTRGLVFNGSADGTFALFNLNGKYQMLKVTAGHIDGSIKQPAKLNIYLDDELTITYDISYMSLPKALEIPLNGALHMRMEIVGCDNYSQFGIFNGKFE